MGFPIDKKGLLFSVEKLVDSADLETPFVNNEPGKKRYYNFLKRHLHSVLSQNMPNMLTMQEVLYRVVSRSFILIGRR